MLKINGKECGQYIGCSVAEMLEKEQYILTRVAVEKNGEILPKAQYDEAILRDGDTVEVVCFMGGG